MEIFETIYGEGISLVGILWNSSFFVFIKFLLAVYTLVLLADLIMLLVLRGLGQDIRKDRYGADMPVAYKKATTKQWLSVEKHLSGHSSQDWKIAVLEADKIVEDILNKVGFSGENFRERIENVHPDSLEKREELLRAHSVRNAIIKDSDYVLEKGEARETVQIYEEFLKDWEAL
ncbi:MAG: hypothetical protein EOM19_03385 [Candidatus Moranbacteria bacterium]|nr:hypothetical protein [Candidatus Moranbacteria bacterium]